MEITIVSLAGEFAQGKPLRPVAEEIPLPAEIVEPDRDLLFRVGKKIEEARRGDYLLVELRTRVHTGEYVLASDAKERLYLGRWWAKHGKRELQDKHGKVILEAPTVVGVVNMIVRL